MLRTNTKPHHLIKHAKISYFIASLVFHKFWYRTYRNGLNQVPQSWGPLGPQKIRVVLVLYLFSKIFILLCSCTGCGTSKICLYLKDNRSSFSWLSWNPNLRTRVHKHPFCYACEKYVLLKTKIWRWINLDLRLNSWR